MNTAELERVHHPGLGANELYFQPPNLLWIILCGTLDLQEMTAITESSEMLRERCQDKLICLSDLNHLVGISAAARKQAAEQTRLFQISVLYGGNRVQRALGRLMLRVMTLMQKNVTPAKIVNTAEEAEAWIKQSIAEGSS